MKTIGNVFKGRFKLDVADNTEKTNIFVDSVILIVKEMVDTSIFIFGK